MISEIVDFSESLIDYFFFTQDLWIMTIVQLIALFYKDQNVENMQKLLGTWINDSGSDISADADGDESNTSQRSHVIHNLEKFLKYWLCDKLDRFLSADWPELQ